MADNKYIEAIGRRKKAIARVRIYEGGKGEFEVNEKAGNEFFPVFEHNQMVVAPFNAVGQDGKFDVTVKVRGGGPAGQAGGRDPDPDRGRLHGLGWGGQGGSLSPTRRRPGRLRHA